MAKPKVIQKLKELREGKSVEGTKQKKIQPTDDCVICYEILKKEVVVFCRIWLYFVVFNVFCRILSYLVVFCCILWYLVVFGGSW